MRITIELSESPGYSGSAASAEDGGTVLAMQLFRQALAAVGFHPANVAELEESAVELKAENERLNGLVTALAAQLKEFQSPDETLIKFFASESHRSKSITPRTTEHF